MPVRYPLARESDPVFPRLDAGYGPLVKLQKIIQKRIRRQSTGVNAVGDVNAVVSANVNEGGSRSHLSTRSRQRIVQRSGRTDVADERETSRDTGDPAESPPPATPPIDEDVAGSVNAALHDTDE